MFTVRVERNGNLNINFKAILIVIAFWIIAAFIFTAGAILIPIMALLFFITISVFVYRIAVDLLEGNMKP
jgi:hypothetical protein